MTMFADAIAALDWAAKRVGTEGHHQHKINWRMGAAAQRL
jgi:hypothetical protein